MSTEDDVPKAILYSWPSSVWSMVPMLCLVEKGYGEDEYVVRNVDITKGENFSPSYLKINKNGTVPTLVVPMAETTSADVDSRYRSLRDTITICNFLDHARSANTQNTTSARPAPALAPATIEGKALSDEIISLVHLPSVDPNFLNMSARDQAELDKKASGAPGTMLSERRQNLDKYIVEAKKLAANGGSFESSLVKLLQEKHDANDVVWKVYQGQAEKEELDIYFSASRNIWTKGLPEAMNKLESLIKEDGPYCMGDQIALADLHVIAWMARVVLLAGGSYDPAGLTAVEKLSEGKTFGPKVKAFWAAWLQRDSFRKVLVPSAQAFHNAGNGGR